MSKSKKLQVSTYDFRLSLNKSDGTQLEYKFLGEKLSELCKKFVFQLEKGSENGYMHYQGRLSLRTAKIEKTFRNELFSLLNYKEEDGFYIGPTSKGVHSTSNFNYVMKSDTREGGPWKESEFILGNKEEIYIPPQYDYKFEELYGYQKEIYNKCTIIDYNDKKTVRDEFRYINVVVMTDGNNGKTTLCHYTALHKGCIVLPPVMEAKDLIQSCCDICVNKKLRTPNTIFIDLPRALNKKNLREMYFAIEQIKGGHLYDVRHSYKDYYIASPHIWIFTNEYPDLTALSIDRFKVWNISKDKSKLELFMPKV